MAEHYPKVQVSITRGSTELQVLQLRAHQLDALVVDARCVLPAPDLLIEPLGELRACFACRADHPLTQLPAVTLPQLLAYPVASTPLSDDVERLMVDLYGPHANPAQMTTLQCEDVTSLISATEQSQAVFLGIAAAVREGVEAGRLVELRMQPRFDAAARFAYITLAGRTQTPVMSVFRRFVSQRLHD